jgi:kynurenine 3-monooxygenase
MNGQASATVVGAGCAGPLLAALLAKRGFRVTLHERRRDPRLGFREAGRSINLALAARGLHALEKAGLRGAIEDLLVPMRGRLVHAPDGSRTFLPYGRLPHEFIWSISRGDLNERLLTAAEQRGVEIRFSSRCIDADLPAGKVHFEVGAGRIQQVAFSPDNPVIATDGARSAVRASMQQAGETTLREDLLSHSYKELLIPAGTGGAYLMEREVLHIWPRGSYMLIALPNNDGSFTATLFLERSGANPCFESLHDAAAVNSLMRRDFADAAELIPDLATQFLANPPGNMSTLHVSRWHDPRGVLLMGDAAHGIVPFHGQGMNCAFEDCTVLNELLDRGQGWAASFAQFAGQRFPDTESIARMAVENYEEMRNTVRDPTVPAEKEALAGTRAPASGPLHPALFDGQLSRGNSLLRGRASRGDPGANPQRGCARTRRPGKSRLCAHRGDDSRAARAAAGGTGSGRMKYSKSGAREFAQAQLRGIWAATPTPFLAGPVARHRRVRTEPAALDRLAAGRRLFRRRQAGRILLDVGRGAHGSGRGGSAQLQRGARRAGVMISCSDQNMDTVLELAHHAASDWRRLRGRAQPDPALCHRRRSRWSTSITATWRMRCRSPWSCGATRMRATS